jgi:hypothetical protein
LNINRKLRKKLKENKEKLKEKDDVLAGKNKSFVKLNDELAVEKGQHANTRMRVNDLIDERDIAVGEKNTAEGERDAAQRELATERNEHDDTRRLLNDSSNVIDNAKLHLGVVDLENLPNMNGKTLLELINHICPTPPSHTCPPCGLEHLDSHVCPPCQLPHLDTHTCPICPEICCQGDYEKVKEELEKLKGKLSRKERKIVNKIIASCQLDLEMSGGEQSSLEQLISHLKELLKTPDIVEQGGIDSTELEALRKDIRDLQGIRNNLKTENRTLRNRFNYSEKINLLLIIFLIGSWLIIGGLVISKMVGKKGKGKLKMK